MPARLTVFAPDGVGEVRPGDDLAALLLTALADAGEPLQDGDVVAVTSKAVAKAAGRVRTGGRAEAIAEDTVRVVAQRGATTIARTRQGLTLAAAGVDASNVEPGSVVLLPRDPDASARALRALLTVRTGLDIAVVVTDTAGRPWREGQTDIAIGAAGLRVLDDHTGRTDTHGNTLTVTAPAVADEIASAAELAQGKLGRRPFAVVRGLADLVLPPDQDGPGAIALVRAAEHDLFGLGAREAVVAALSGHDAEAFGAPAGSADLAAAVRTVLPGAEVTVRDDDSVVVRAALSAGFLSSRLRPLSLAFGRPHDWVPSPAGRTGGRTGGHPAELTGEGAAGGSDPVVVHFPPATP